MIYQHLGDTRALDAIHRGMNIYLLTQQGALVRVFRRQFIVDLHPKPRRLARVQSCRRAEHRFGFAGVPHISSASAGS
jgi:hypothetical protein